VYGNNADSDGYENPGPVEHEPAEIPDNSISGTIWIDASVDRVWELISDIDKLPIFFESLLSAEWIAPYTRPGVGAQFLAVHESQRNSREWIETSHIVEFAPPDRIAWASQSEERPPTLCRFTLEPHKEGTELTQTIEFIPARIEPPG
jgi:uncharacterized protein YndB with AHSA1/START domain